MSSARRTRVWPALLAAALVLLIAAPFIAGFAIRTAFNDGAVPVARDLWVAGAPRTMMAIWAHPDDEITSAGTLARMGHDDGARLVLVYLTRGEAYSGTDLSRDELTRVRTREAQAAGRILGAEETILLDYPDGGLPEADGRAAMRDLGAIIARVRPSVVVSFDDRVGFYGHSDHRQVGIWVRALMAEAADDPHSSVRAYYQATLPAPMIAMARRMVSAFRERYPSDPARGLPAPTVAINIASEAERKRGVLDAHASQIAVVADVQPYYDRAPPWAYYRILDREYYTRVR